MWRGAHTGSEGQSFVLIKTDHPRSRDMMSLTSFLEGRPRLAVPGPSIGPRFFQFMLKCCVTPG